MTSSRVSLVTAAIVAAILLAQAFVSTVLSVVYGGFLVTNSGIQAFPISGFVLNDVFSIVAFGLGVWLSLRRVAPVRATDRWTRVIGRGFIAALMGTLAVFVLALVWALLATIHVSGYPFGYSLDPSVDASALGTNVLSIAQAVFTALIEWFPLVVLATVLERLWLGAHPDVVDATVPASPAGTLVDH